MRTKRDIWNQVVDLLTLKQLEKTMGASMTYDSKFDFARQVTKSKKILALCEEGLRAPSTFKCVECGAALKPYWLKEGRCNGCRNPDLIVETKESI